MNANRKANIFVNGTLAGTLLEIQKSKGDVYIFNYNSEYLSTGSPIGFHFPLSSTPYQFDGLPPFFANLASEGHLKKIQCERDRIDPNDTFGLLLVNGKNLIGALSIVPNY